MKNIYRQNFYTNRHRKTAYSAQTILALVLDALPQVHSVVDFGCGVGTWLSVLKERGISKIRGLDGPWVDQNLLEIPKEDFRNANFEELIVLEERFDLAITLEVAEHVSKESARIFVESLVSASDFVLFSAAIPFQGGEGHVNEQWPEYWVELFAAKGYDTFDFVRREIWNDNKIPFWYRQNILLFAKREACEGSILASSNKYEYSLPLAVVHPDMYLSRVDPSVTGRLVLFRRAVKAWISKRITKSSGFVA